MITPKITLEDKTVTFHLSIPKTLIYHCEYTLSLFNELNKLDDDIVEQLKILTEIAIKIKEDSKG